MKSFRQIPVILYVTCKASFFRVTFKITDSEENLAKMEQPTGTVEK